MMVPWSGRWVRVSISEQRQNNPHNPLNFQLENPKKNALFFFCKTVKTLDPAPERWRGTGGALEGSPKEDRMNVLSKFHKYIFVQIAWGGRRVKGDWRWLGWVGGNREGGQREESPLPWGVRGGQRTVMGNLLHSLSSAVTLKSSLSSKMTF